MDLERAFAQIDLFSNLSQENLWQVIAIAEEHHVEAGVQITRQADLGAAFIYIESGEAVIERINEQGQKRPERPVGAGYSYGVTSLFVGEPRDVTITTVSPAHIWMIHRAPFQALLASDPGLRRQLRLPPNVVELLRAPRFPWLDQGEYVMLHARRHWLIFARSVALITLAVLAYLAFLAWSVLHWRDFAVSLWVALLPVVGLYVPALIWFWVDWRNDYFAVTTRGSPGVTASPFCTNRDKRSPSIACRTSRWIGTCSAAWLAWQPDHRNGRRRGHCVVRCDLFAGACGRGDLCSDRAGAIVAAAQQRQLIRESLAGHLGLEVPAPAPEAGPGEERPIDEAWETACRRTCGLDSWRGPWPGWRTTS